MLKKLYAHTAARKTALLAAALALVSALIGGELRAREPAPAGQAAMPVLKPGLAEPAPARAQSPASLLSGGEYPAISKEPVFPRVSEPSAPADPPAKAGFIYSEEIPLSYELQDYTFRRCLDRELEYELILALMWRESGFQLDAVGYNDNGTRDSGVMQINDVNRGWLREEHGITDLMDPYQNIDAGTLILGGFAEKYGVTGALMAYQYGEEGMKRKHAEGVYTNDLIAKLMTKRDEIALQLRVNTVDSHMPRNP